MPRHPLASRIKPSRILRSLMRVRRASSEINRPIRCQPLARWEAPPYARGAPGWHTASASRACGILTKTPDPSLPGSALDSRVLPHTYSFKTRALGPRDVPAHIYAGTRVAGFSPSLLGVGWGRRTPATPPHSPKLHGPASACLCRSTCAMLQNPNVPQRLLDLRHPEWCAGRCP